MSASENATRIRHAPAAKSQRGKCSNQRGSTRTTEMTALHSQGQNARKTANEPSMPLRHHTCFLHRISSGGLDGAVRVDWNTSRPTAGRGSCKPALLISKLTANL